MNFDITRIPFSRFGSYFSMSYIKKELWGEQYEEGLFLRSVHGRLRRKELFSIETINSSGEVIPFQLQTSPEMVDITCDQGKAKIYMPRAEVVLIEGSGIGMRLSAHRKGLFVVPITEGKWLINLYEEGIQIMLAVLCGSARVIAPWNGLKCESFSLEIIPKDGQFKMLIFEDNENEIADQNLLNLVETCSPEIVRREFELFLQKLPTLPPKFSYSRELAGYILWSSFVRPSGQLKRPAMLMSKNWMTDLWSWDHCFNAIALSYGHQDLAWDQFAVIFDFQRSSGVLPDFVNDHESYWNFCKPPIHGWAVDKLSSVLPIERHVEIEELYLALEKWTEWWLKYRDYDNDGIPQYNHGNDSGWDNSTVFLESPPIESPELSAFLIKQMEILSWLAEKMGRSDLATKWREEASKMFKRLLNHFVRDSELIPLKSGSHKVIKSMSLLPFISMILGNKLPKQILEKSISRLREFITPHGLATEKLDSPYYTGDGYWRGPIWAPVVMILVDSLKKIGQCALAEQISKSFVELVAKEGFAENFDAITGRALRDPAHTWTASVFLILAIELKN